MKTLNDYLAKISEDETSFTFYRVGDDRHPIGYAVADGRMLIVYYEPEGHQAASRIGEVFHPDYFSKPTSAFRLLANHENAIAEARGEPLVCPNCEGTSFEWMLFVSARSGINPHQMSAHDAKVEFALGCTGCSETVKIISGDDAAALLPVPGSAE